MDTTEKTESVPATETAVVLSGLQPGFTYIFEVHIALYDNCRKHERYHLWCLGLKLSKQELAIVYGS